MRSTRQSLASVWTATTGRGRATALLGLLLGYGGLAWHYPVLGALGGCLVVLVLLELVAVLGSRGVSAVREVEPAVVRRHGLCTGRLTVSGRRRRGLVRLDVADQVDGRLVPIRLPERPDAEGNERTSVAYEIPTPRRGLVDIGPVRLRLVGLTGMAAHAVDTGGVDQVRVLPREIPLASMMSGHRRAPAGSDDSIELGGTDLVGLHHYAMGDDLRRLHWATSARTGTLMVREDAEPSEPNVCVVLDDRAASYASASRDAGGSHDLFEEAVELASALCRVAVASGNPVRFETASGRESVVIPGSASRQPRREQMELDWLLAEIDVTAGAENLDVDARDLDVGVVVTGPASDLHELGMALGAAPVRVLGVVDPQPSVATVHQGGLLRLHGATSVSLAMLWDQAAQR